MAVFTPRGLKIRLPAQWAFGLLGRLWNEDSRTDAFRVLKTCEAIELVPEVIGYVSGLAAACLCPGLSWVICLARIAGASTGALLTQTGEFIILRPTGILSVAHIWSWVHGYGLLQVLALSVVYVMAGWLGIVFWVVGGIIAFFANGAVFIGVSKKRYQRLDNGITEAEVNFFNAYRLHADRLGITRNLLLDDSEQASEVWRMCLADYAMKYPEAVRRFNDPAVEEMVTLGETGLADQAASPGSAAPSPTQIRVNLLNPACKLMPPILPLPEWVDPEVYSVADWTVGRDVSADVVGEWLDLDTQQLFAIRRLMLSERRYVAPEFVTRSEWEEQAAYHGVQRDQEAERVLEQTTIEDTDRQEPVLCNRWTGGRTHLVFPPLPPKLHCQTGAMFQSWVFSTAVGEEIALFLLDDPDFARQLGTLKPFNLTAKTGVAHTSAGAITFILWTVSSHNGHVVDYEHLLHPFSLGTRQMLWDASKQDVLKVLIRESLQGETVGFLEFENDFDLDVLASMCDQLIRNEPTADFEETKAALFAEYTLEDLRSA